MKLDDGQRKKVTEWIGQGLKLSEIQKRLGSELDLHLTYMDVRLLVDDLKLTPKDIEPPKPGGAALQSAPAGGKSAPVAPPPPTPAARPGGVFINVDETARPGAVISGKVTFSDGNAAEWYFDQTGQPRLLPQQAGYRPSAGDLQQFQTALEAELSKLGF